MSEEEEIVPGCNRGLHKRRNLFGKKRRETFLEHLAATCNVTASAAVAEVSVSTVYANRMKDAEFRDGWRAALEQGHAQLEAALLARAARQKESHGCAATGKSAAGLRRIGLGRLAGVADDGGARLRQDACRGGMGERTGAREPWRADRSRRRDGRRGGEGDGAGPERADRRGADGQDAGLVTVQRRARLAERHVRFRLFARAAG